MTDEPELESYEHLLGRKAYEAYCLSTNWKSAISGADLPQFDNTPPAVQNGWIRAAMEINTFVRFALSDRKEETK